MALKQKDLLDKTEAFLAKRDGIDKVKYGEMADLEKIISYLKMEAFNNSPGA